MSKAFTRESDFDEDDRLPPVSSPLPSGARNYVTNSGLRALKEELDLLLQQRPLLAAKPGDPDAKRQLQSLDARISYLQSSIATAVEVPVPPQPWEEIAFSATVALRDKGGALETYRIVGADEADIDRNWISFFSPLARALMKARKGQTVRFRAPGGEQVFEVVDIRYDAPT